MDDFLLTVIFIKLTSEKCETTDIELNKNEEEELCS